MERFFIGWNNVRISIRIFKMIFYHTIIPAIIKLVSNRMSGQWISGNQWGADFGARRGKLETQYIIYVHKDDYEKACYLLR